MKATIRRVEMEGFIKFFGTGGARFVASRQLRATGGLWLKYKETNLYIDPGPGAIVKIRESQERFEPSDLAGIILTHKHMDHSNDVNILIESMAEGGFKKRGTLFAPEDAVGEDPVVHRFVRNYLDDIVLFKEKGRYSIKDIFFSTPVRHRHPVETFGLVFHLNVTIGLIADTRFFDKLPDYYKVDYLIINVLRSQPIENHEIIEHLAVNDVRAIVNRVRPKTAILTHFGFKMIQEGPDQIARRLSDETDVNVVAAQDGMKWEF
jgi:ribonuclease BN (tRNA processing enzyme)